jgi:transcriptional regulator with XRE-family HTH domain
MTIKERIYSFIEYKGITVKKFEELCGLSNGYISSMRKGFGTDKLNNVLTMFPELNREWLLYGEGEMLNPKVIQNNQNGDNIQGHSVTVNKTEKDYLEIIKRQSEQLSKSQEQIDRLLSIIENFGK